MKYHYERFLLKLRAYGIHGDQVVTAIIVALALSLITLSTTIIQWMIEDKWFSEHPHA